MNLTEMAAHVCEQVGMNDTDDTAAAMMFLRRRLEMIWNSQLWRVSLVEAVTTLATDGSSTLANVLWCPARGTVTLPTEFETLLAVRTDGHALNVASLEAYYRTDTNYLDMSGDPTEFQLLRDAVWEFNAATPVAAAVTSGTIAVDYSTDNVSTIQATMSNSSQISPLIIFKATRSTDDPASLQPIIGTTTWTAYNAGSPDANGIYTFISNNYLGVGIRQWNAPNGWTLQSFDGMSWALADAGSMLRYTATGTTLNTPPNSGWVASFSGGAAPAPSAYMGTATSYPGLTFSDRTLQARKRFRLSATPTVAVTLRMLGKTRCPDVNDYDNLPITHAEPCVMAFARGDMLMRQRQHGKAQMAQQEGSTLIKQLAVLEAHEQAANHRIQPAEGFGGDTLHYCPHF